jgi:hypothetical protein
MVVVKDFLSTPYLVALRLEHEDWNHRGQVISVAHMPRI